MTPASQGQGADGIVVPERPAREAPTGGALPEPLGTLASSEELRAIAQASGLRQMGVRPPLTDYVRSLWARRSFIRTLGSAKAYARNQGSYLGQLWSVLTPLLNSLVYVFIFGILIETTRGMENGIAFIVTGVFLYRFFDASVSAGANSLKGNMNLVRSVHFPRAVLPISTTITELATLGPALAVMCVVSWASGLLPMQGEVPITWRLLLLPVAVALMWLFNTGCAFFVARWVAITPDLNNVIPFALRFVFYASGVLFSIDNLIKNELLAAVLSYQPIAVFLDIARSTVLNEPTIPLDPKMWLAAVGWAVVTLVAGFLVFWRGEERYGRD
ncbi:ABC transporter permease [Cellulomonas sp. PhB150]|uniref:ABC transporter permease n=1 Tax=Cellulomonas sp. PhB150 TaxID=2485188 RepID=UPI000FBF808F|nr:ABC transporter permease [Cellulomonas sp. PhB150]ROS31210.1 teichoic acid transport system permease protein [Cellulomonas sp. PhB150]